MYWAFARSVPLTGRLFTVLITKLRVCMQPIGQDTSKKAERKRLRSGGVSSNSRTSVHALNECERTKNKKQMQIPMTASRTSCECHFLASSKSARARVLASSESGAPLAEELSRNCTSATISGVRERSVSERPCRKPAVDAVSYAFATFPNCFWYASWAAQLLALDTRTVDSSS